MTIDERLERLTERHEALAQSIELMRAEGEQTAAKIRGLAIIAEQNEVRAGEMMQAIASLGGRVAEIAEESRAADQRLGARIEETDKRLGERIETMISAMGGYIRDHPPTA